MDRPAAMEILGVTDASTADDVRARYLALVRAHHPDVVPTATRRASSVDVAEVTEAYRVVRTTERAAAPPPPEVIADGDTLVLALPPDEAFFLILDLAWSVGDVTYVDPEVGLVETVATLSSGVTCSIVLTLQGRATGTTDAFCTLAALGRGEPPPADSLVAELAAIMRGEH